MPPSAEPVTAFTLRDWPLPQPTGAKHSRGQVLVVGGSPQAPGAVMLAGLAALRVGAGVLRLAVAASVAAPVATAVPEAAVTALVELDGVSTGAELNGALSSVDTVLVGPGLVEPDGARAVLETVLRERGAGTGLVIDAFALGVLPDVSAGPKLGNHCVLTPNRVEAARLLDCDVDALADRTPDDIAAELAARYSAVVTCSGAVADPNGRRWTVPTGHVGLGTSGSGDVLAGTVAGLLARGAEPAQAACWGTFLHGSAGDRLAARVGRLGFLARELVDELPLVIVQTEA